MNQGAPSIRAFSTDLEALIDRAADHMHIDAAFVEKDFWSTEVLRAATQHAEAAGTRAIFKGGTSLSRAYGIIDRFSEDIDLLLAFPDDMTRGARDRVIKGIGSAVALHLGLDSGNVHPDSSTTGVKRNYRFLYPNTKRSMDISDGVYLEMGNRGGPDPTTRRRLRSMIADFALTSLGETEDTWSEFAEIAVEVLAPERTLLEKLALITAADASFRSGTLDAFAKHGRHLYDIHCLLQDQTVIERLTRLGTAGIAELADSIHERSVIAGWASVPRPEHGYASCPVFEDDSASQGALRRSFETALGLVYGPRPSFGDCMQTLHTRAELI